MVGLKKLTARSLFDEAFSRQLSAALSLQLVGFQLMAES
jgi:hypothetical protein